MGIATPEKKLKSTILKHLKLSYKHANTALPKLEQLEPRLMLAADPIGYWTFDNIVNLGVDNSGNGNNLTNNGGATQDPNGRHGAALSVDGVDDYLGGIAPTGLPTANSNYTISAWMKPDTVGAKGLVGWGNYGSTRQVNALRIFGDNGFRHYWWGADLDSNAPAGTDLDDGSWHHVVATFNGTTRQLYLNGSLIGSDTPGVNNATNQNFAIGRTCTICGGGEFFDGSLDDVAIWDTALESNQIIALANGSSPLDIPEPGDTLVSQWVADDLVGSFTDGQTVSAWQDSVGSILANATGNPILNTNAINGHATVTFDPSDGNDQLRINAADNPISNANDFSISVVFQANQPGPAGANWYNGAGIVDAEQPGAANDYGISLNGASGVHAGLGNPDLTLSSTLEGLADGLPHVIVYARQGGTVKLSVDGQSIDTTTGGSTAARGNFDLVFGSIQTNINYLDGSIAEVRIYNESLSNDAMNTVSDELIETYDIQEPQAPSTLSIAGDLLVDLKATDPTAGTLSWTNAGTLGDFSLIGNPIVETIDGVVAINFNSDNPAANFDDAYQGPLAPASITGSSPRSIEIWAHNPADGLQALEETAIAWGRRGGPEGSNMSFGYGNSDMWGAVGAWGAPDTPWSDTGGSPTLGQWHHLAMVYDGATISLYADGNLVNSDTVALNTHTNTTINLAAQNDRNTGNITLTDGRPGSLSLANVRVHSDALTALEVLGNYNAGIQVAGEPPVAANDNYDVNEDATLTVTLPNGVLANDTDPEELPLTAQLALDQDVQHGSLTLNSDGTFTYTPDSDFNGTDTFSYVANNGILNSNLALVTITVNPQYDSPVANPDGYVTEPGTPLTVTPANGVLTNDNNIDNATLSAIVEDDPTNGNVTLNTDGSFTYTPNPGFSGTDLFTYKIDDATSFSNITTVTIEVDNAPVANDDAYEINEEEILTINAAEGVLANDTDNEDDALESTLDTPPSNGSLTLNLDGSFVYTPDPDFFGIDTFTYTVSDGDQTSNTATVTINVLPVPDPPIGNDDLYFVDADDILEVGTNIRVTANDIDVDNLNPNVLLNTDVSNGSLTFFPDGTFTYVPNPGFIGIDSFSYIFDVQSTPNDPATVQIVVNAPDPQIVINEINVDPPDNTVPAEFIELYNNDTSPINLSGWQFADGIDYTFPIGTILNPGEYLVIAEDPDTIDNLYGVTALGPWDGALRNEGERIQLENADGDLIDEVDYNIGSPWPTSAFGDGPSLELINPDLNNNLGSSWRSSAADGTLPVDPVTLLSLADTNWSYRPGTSEPVFPIGAWTDPAFNEDASWLTGQSPIGYGDGDDNTVLNDMQGNYTSVYLRNTFEVTGDIPSQLQIRTYYDDGAIVYINGVEVGRLNVAAGQITFDGTAGPPDHEAAFDTINILNADALLVAGTNTIAIHGLNVQLDSSDFSIDASVIIPGQEGIVGEPTPGEQNSIFANNTSPNIRDISHTPTQPASGAAVPITAKVTDPDGVQSVTLYYQVVNAGDYIPAYLPVPISTLQIDPDADLIQNPDYWDAANWIDLVMVDDGTNGDAVAGDDIYTALIPAQDHRTLVRYKMTVEDTLGASDTLPYADDPNLNFAYYVYDGVPDYQGPDGTIYDAETLEELPVYQLITRGTDWDQVQAFDAADEIPQFFNGAANPARFVYNWHATFVYDGVVYDNIKYRLRGANGRYLGGDTKRSMRFRFNKGQYLQAKDAQGNEYPTVWRTLTTGKGFDNRLTLTHALNEGINFYIFNQLGVPAPFTHNFHFRVVDDANEAPDSFRGDFYGLNFTTETYDNRFLDSHNLEEGNLYKLINSTQGALRQQRVQADNGVTDGSDHDNIEQNLTGNSTPEFIEAHVNLDSWYTYHALSQAIRHYDYWPSANKNMVYYFEPDYTPENNNLGKLNILPWDTDASWGPTWNNGHDVVYNSIFPATGGGADSASNPTLQPGYFNAIRELRDLLWQEDQIYPLIDHFADQIDAFVEADRARWINAPADAGNYNGIGGAGKAGLANLVQDMKNFAFNGGSWPGGSVGAGGRAAFLDSLDASSGEGNLIPDTPTVTYTGAANFPVNALSFQTSAFSDPQNDNFQAMEWRVASIEDTSSPDYDVYGNFKLEINAEWESGLIESFSDTIAIPSSAVDPEKTYRVRVRMLDDTGRWSHWSDATEFTTTPADVSDLQQNLRVSEIHYNPSAVTPAELVNNPDVNNDDFEFIELTNIGDTVLNLTGVQFTDGIDFAFPDNTLLAPGEFIVIAGNESSFTSRHASIAQLGGSFDGNLSNGGENITISFGSATIIQDFEYNDGGNWPGRADGTGSSLEIVDPTGDYNDPDNWRSSYEFEGSPARPGIGNRSDIVINEVLAHTDIPQLDSIELHNTTDSPVDVSGWWLSDNNTNFQMFQIPNGISIPANGYIVFDESDFNPTPLNPGPNDFALSSTGEDVWLLEGDLSGRVLDFVDHAEFGASLNGVSFGRFPNATGPLYPMESLTLAGQNSGPRMGDVIITEIMYAPADPGIDGLTANDLEFVEIYNTSDTTIDLTDWELDGTSSNAPPGLQVAPSQTKVLILTSTANDPDKLAAFKEFYNIDDSVDIVGFFSGRLDNSGEELTLLRADEPPLDDPDTIPLVIEDQVEYGTTAPWPTSPASGLASLNRTAVDSFGNDLTSWNAAAPTPGTVNIVPQIDGDFDDDTDVDADDIDLLVDEIINGSNNTDFDLTDDDLVNQDDLDELIENIIGTAYGDANLDKIVNLEDLAKLATNFGQSNRGWAEGNFTADNVVDLADLAKLATNFGTDLTGGAAASESNLLSEAATNNKTSNEAFLVNTDATLSSSNNSSTWDHIDNLLNDDEEESII